MFISNEGLLPEIVDIFFATNNEIHSYDTRSRNIYIHWCLNMCLNEINQPMRNINLESKHTIRNSTWRQQVFTTKLQTFKETLFDSW